MRWLIGLAVLVGLPFPLAASAQVDGRGPGARCEALRLQATEQLESAAFEAEQTRASGSGADDAARALVAPRARLAHEAAKSRLAYLELSCADAGGDLGLEDQHRLEAIYRDWLRVDCHREGKDLALAEVEKDQARIDFYRPRIEACIASGRGSAEVRFTTADGGVVHARLAGVGSRGVVLAHGGRFTKESWNDQVPILVDAGYRVLAIDFRGRGRSRGPDPARPGGARPGRVFQDVLAGVRYLRSTGSTTVSVVGASFGGGAAAQAAVEAEPGEIDSLVLLAHSVIARPEAMRGRILFIVAEHDVRGGGVRRLEEIRRQYEAAPGPKELLVLEGEAHAQFLFDTDQAAPLMQAILTFLESQPAD